MSLVRLFPVLRQFDGLSQAGVVQIQRERRFTAGLMDKELTERGYPDVIVCMFVGMVRAQGAGEA